MARRLGAFGAGVIAAEGDDAAVAPKEETVEPSGGHGEPRDAPARAMPPGKTAADRPRVSTSGPTWAPRV